MAVLAPGTLLRLMYLRERLRHIMSGQFLEIDSGSRGIARLLLDQGWFGESCELVRITIERPQGRFVNEIKRGQYQLMLTFSLKQQPEWANLVNSCMIIENLDDTAEYLFMRRSSEVLKSDGLVIAFVPSPSTNWDIADYIAGYCRRYMRDKIRSLMANIGWTIENFVEPTFPISNFLVNRCDKSMLSLSMIKRAKHSGCRNVNFKTHFLFLLGMILNQFSLRLLRQLQKFFKNDGRALAIYFESIPNSLT